MTALPEASEVCEHGCRHFCLESATVVPESVQFPFVTFLKGVYLFPSVSPRFFFFLWHFSPVFIRIILPSFSFPFSYLSASSLLSLEDHLCWLTVLGEKKATQNSLINEGSYWSAPTTEQQYLDLYFPFPLLTHINTSKIHTHTQTILYQASCQQKGVFEEWVEESMHAH